jgi:dolichyl-phosphate beta-glucosyltransferase
MEKTFSIIIPAFNEKDRLPVFLSGLKEALSKERLQGEIIIVDDGSLPEHGKVYESLVGKTGAAEFRLIKHLKNKGKGAAIRTGFDSAKGEWLGFVDADGSTKPCEIIRLLKIVLSSCDLDGVFGARIRMLGYDVDRLFKRHFFGRIFTTLVYVCLRVPMYDSQCGCKFFRAEKIKPLLGLLREDGFLFDVELLSLGYRKGLRFLEVPISWHETGGSKVNMLTDGVKMVLGLFRVRRNLLKNG